MLKAYANGSMFAEARGEGPARVLLLHGWARSSRDFDSVASLLASAGYASLAVDLPGFGATPAPQVPGGARHYADLLEDLLTELGEGPLCLVGHSFGGRIATVVAARHPERIDSLVLTGAPLLRRETTKKPAMAYRTLRWLNEKGLVSDERMERARQRHGSTDYRNASGVIRDVLVATVNESYEEELTQWRGPSSLVWGERDLDVPVAVAQRIVALLKDADLEILEGVGHLVPTEAPEQLANAIIKVLG